MLDARVPTMAQWIRFLTAAARLAVEVRLATVAAQIQSLAWKLPYAVGVAIKKKKILDAHREMGDLSWGADM